MCVKVNNDEFYCNAVRLKIHMISFLDRLFRLVTCLVIGNQFVDACICDHGYKNSFLANRYGHLINHTSQMKLYSDGIQQ